MTDQIIVEVDGIGELEFPDGTDPSVIQATVKRLTQERAPKEPERFISSMDDAWMRTQEPELRGQGAATLPAVGGMLGSVAGPTGAAIGGATGALLRDTVYAARGDARVPRSGLEAAGNVGVNAAAQGALAKGGQLIDRGVRAAGQAVSNRAVPMVRSALKPVWAEVRKRAGIEGEMPARVAEQQARFIISHQLRTPEQARELVQASGRQVDDAIAQAEQANPNIALDTAERVPRYLNAVLRRVEKQVLPGKDRAAIQNVGREVVEDSPLSRSTYQPLAAETLESGLARGVNEARAIARNARKQPVQGEGLSQFTDAGGAFPRSSRPRALRTDVKPSEGMAMVRTKSFFDKDAKAGEVAGGKAIERAVRDSVKTEVPATREPLRVQGRAMDAERLLDRATWRDANRDAVGMGGIAGLANGRPLTALVLQALKEGQLAAGLSAGRYGPRIARSGQPVGFGSEQFMRAVQDLIREQLTAQTPTGPRE